MNKKVIDMFTMAGAVVLGFVIHKLVANYFGMPNTIETITGQSNNSEEVAKASGGCTDQSIAVREASAIAHCQKTGSTYGGMVSCTATSFKFRCIGANGQSNIVTQNYNKRALAKKFF